MAESRQTPRPTNILLILTDQFRFDCLSCAGNPVIRTPNLDRLARLGRRFEYAYSTSPLCIPARTQLLTGMACWQTEVWGLSDRLTPMTPTFATALSQRGYFTGAVGKMHFESCNRVGDIHDSHGFQELVVSEEVSPLDVVEEDDYAKYLKSHGYDLGKYSHGRRSPDYGREGYHAQVSALPNEHFDTTWTGDETLRMLEAHRREPFCIVSSFVKPHFPCELPSDRPCPYDPATLPFRASYNPEPDWQSEKFVLEAQTQQNSLRLGWLEENTLREFAAHYYGNVELIDVQVGRMLDFLEQQGLLDTTLVVFTSDHGECLGERGEVGKMTYYDESTRVPMILAGPMVTNPGAVDPRPAILEDLCPTLMAAGASVSDGLIGQNLLPLLADPELPGRDAVFGIMGGPYHFEPDGAICFVREGDWKYMYQFAGDKEKLYNLANDPIELDDLADGPGYRAHCERLNRRLATWFADNGARFFTKNGRLRRDLSR